MMFCVFLFFSLLPIFIDAVVVSNNETAELFLRRFGYLHRFKNRNRRNLVDLTGGIKKYQSFYHLNITGFLDDATREHMNEPRCCNADLESRSYTLSDHTSYRFFNDSMSPRLTGRNFTWKISRYPSYLRKQNVDEAAKRAMKMWTDVCNLTFTQVWNLKPDIELKFQSPSLHDAQCEEPFEHDTLAHYVIGSIYPKKTHFNEGFRWRTSEHGTTGTKYLVPIIVHEIGHALGFAHNFDKNSIMYSHPVDGVNELSRGDIEACILRYGRKDSPTPVDNCPDTVTRYSNDGTEVCAIIYTEPYCAGDKTPVDSPLNAKDLEYYQTASGGSWSAEISSFEVNPNCFLTICTGRNYEGSCKMYGGESTGYNIGFLNSFDNNIRSLICECIENL